MKKILLMLLALVLVQEMAWAQDVIQKVSGEEIKARIREINEREVVYLQYADTAAAELRLAMDQIRMIKLEKGADQPELLRNLDKNQYSVISGHPGELRLQGKQDAQVYYKGRGAMWGTFGVTVLYPPIGLLTGAVIAAIPPAAENHAPDPVLLSDPNYRKGFKNQAHGKKAGKAAAGFGLGLVGFVVFYVGLAIIILNGF